MIAALRARLRSIVRRHWPRLHLRTILLGTLLLVAALPGVGAVFLRVYENTLVRQTEAELVAQGAALAAIAATLGDHPATPATATAPRTAIAYDDPAGIDLSMATLLPERPPPAPATGPPDPAARRTARRLAPILAETKRSTLAAILLLDAAGRIADGPAAGRSLAALPEVRAALAGTPTTVLRRNAAYRQVYRFEWLSRAAALRVHHARPVMAGGHVVGVLLLSRTARALFRGLYADRGKILLGVALIFAALVALALFLSRGIARPIERLGRATRDVAAGRGTIPPVPATAAIEIQALYADFATMAQAIEHRSRYLRDFAHAMAHEFKTPLAGITGGIELLGDHADSMAAADRHRFVANIAADAARLDRLVSRLLDLARADMARADASTTDCTALLHRLADARADAIAIAVTADAALPHAALPAAALEICLAALIDNAVQAGAAHIGITATTAGDSLVLHLHDDGPGIPPGDRDHIFTPFYTTRREQGGTGLGLAIVASLLRAHGGTIRLVESLTGTTFRITLRSAAG